MEKKIQGSRRKQIRKEKFIGVRVTDELFDFLDEKASRKLQSVSTLVLEAIIAYTGFVPSGHDTAKK